MGYVPDDQLQDLCSRVLSHKSFRTIRETTHATLEQYHLRLHVAVVDGLHPDDDVFEDDRVHVFEVVGEDRYVTGDAVALPSHRLLIGALRLLELSE